MPDTPTSQPAPDSALTTQPSPRRTRHYWFRVVRLFVVALIATVIIVPMSLGFFLMWRLTHVGCARGGTPADYDLTAEEFELQSPQGMTLNAYFLPGTNGATVLVAPTYANDRGGDLPDAAILNRAGFNVMTFDSRICRGASAHSLGYVEADDAVAAYEYLLTRDDVDPERISIHGFSAGGSMSLFTAARIPAIRGVSAKGGYHDFAVQLGLGRFDNALYGLVRLGAEIGYRASTGQDVRVLSPLSAIEAISPRPIFLIYGSTETSLPGARAMLERANATGGNATLWVVPGAGHGNYHSIAGDEYVERLVTFHRDLLLGDA